MGISALPSRRQLPGVRETGDSVCAGVFISPSAKDTMKEWSVTASPRGGLGVVQLCVSRGEEAKDCLLLLRSCDMTEKKKVWACPLSLPSLHQTSVVIRVS